jgi:hypothetical protein
MSYTITLTDGAVFATVADGTINTSSSMTLVGKNYAGYGQFINDDIIRLLESGSNTTPPGAPLTGQLWFDSSTGLLKVYNGTVFKTISAATASGTAPTSNSTGDLWYDTTNQQLNVWTGASWLLIGPQGIPGIGVTGAIPVTITDNTSVKHYCVQMTSNDTIIGIWSPDATFTPQTAIPGFTTIRPGLTLATGIGGNVPLFQGTSTNSQSLSGLSSTQFLRSDANTSTTGTFSVLNNAGLAVGINSDFRVSVSGTAVTVSNQTSNGNINFNVNPSGTPITAMSINGANGAISFNQSSSITGNISVGNLLTGGQVSATGNITGATLNIGNIFNSNANGVGNIGSSATYFNTVFARASSAEYADMAERFAADYEYAPGTVVELGGTEEITIANRDLSDTVFGVISTRAAYLMNGRAGTDATHPPVAMTGRVPVRCIGVIHKGDRLVSAGNGLARSAQPGEANYFTVIGRSLQDKLNIDEGLIEAIVAIT